MSLLGELELAVIGCLKDSISPLVVESFPVSPDHYRLMSPYGAALVMISGSRFQATRAGIQERTTQVLVSLLIRNLTGHAQTYEYMGTVNSLLLGYQPTGWLPLMAVSERIISKDPADGVWQVDMVFETRRLAISQFNSCPL